MGNRPHLHAAGLQLIVKVRETEDSVFTETDLHYACAEFEKANCTLCDLLKLEGPIAVQTLIENFYQQSSGNRLIKSKSSLATTRRVFVPGLMPDAVAIE